MAEIRTPATSANLGPGFDCMGIALNIYNTFHVQAAEKNELINVEERFQGEDNLFLKAYRKGCEALGVFTPVSVTFDCQIPQTRGLGSSASLIVGGLKAASLLHGNRLSDEDILQIACTMEGHPDNTAPCLLGGLCASLQTDDGVWITRQMPVSEKWRFTVLIPEFEVATKEARSILPDSYSRRTAAANAAHAVLLARALADGDEQLLRDASKDQLHDPYRRTLIPHFEEIRKICEEDTGGVLVISGSGPAGLLIHTKPLSEETLQKLYALSPDQKILPAEKANGTEVYP